MTQDRTDGGRSEGACTDARGGETQLLLQADVDGALSAAEATRVGAHLESCASCRQVQADLIALADRLRTDAPRYRASDSLRAAVRARIGAAETMVSPDRPPKRFDRGRLRSLSGIPAFGGGVLAAGLAVLLLIPHGTGPQGGDPSDAIVSAHIRALQPGHLMDVISTDQHTVKPWFDGRLPFAPPVKDLGPVGFPLTGGRLDYVGRHTAAALVYRHGGHDINLFVWPDRDARSSPATGTRDGYHFETWAQDDMVFWAVSDLNAKDLADFVERWRAL